MKRVMKVFIAAVYRSALCAVDVFAGSSAGKADALTIYAVRHGGRHFQSDGQGTGDFRRYTD
jgi:hypothetical protein